MSSRLIYIIRHGETDYNKLGIVQGSGVDMPLNEKGMMQARKFYDYYKHIKFSRIYTSALVRTQQSVLPFIESGFKYESYAELNEISWGIFEGRPQSKEERQDYWNVVNAWKNGDYHSKIEGGESAFALQKRQRRFIDLINHRNEDCILIAMHGRAMKSMLCTLLNKPLSAMEMFEHSNLCLYIVEVGSDGLEVLLQNDISHLKA